MISSVVARLTGNDVLSSVLAVITEWPQVQVGQAVQEIALPLTLETASTEEMECLHDRLRSVPGVQFVDVVCIYF
jgi:hypothetical protein